LLESFEAGEAGLFGGVEGGKELGLHGKGRWPELQ
jgi:hypothetical protein